MLQTEFIPEDNIQKETTHIRKLIQEEINKKETSQVTSAEQAYSKEPDQVPSQEPLFSEELQTMINNCTLVPCESAAIAAPIFVIPKKENGIRWVSVSNTAQELEDLNIHLVD